MQLRRLNLTCSLEVHAAHAHLASLSFLVAAATSNRIPGDSASRPPACPLSVDSNCLVWLSSIIASRRFTSRLVSSRLVSSRLGLAEIRARLLVPHYCIDSHSLSQSTLAIPNDACPAQPHSLGDDPNEQTLSLRPNPRHSFASSDRFAPSTTHATKRKAPSSRLCDQTPRRELERSVGFDTERIARSLARSARRSGTRRRALFFWVASSVHCPYREISHRARIATTRTLTRSTLFET